ncbi:hypothetical protein CR513_56521, partial [Mucuna pruriens]
MVKDTSMWVTRQFKLRLLLKIGFYLDLDETFIVLSFKWNLNSISALRIYVKSDYGGEYYGRNDGSKECDIVPHNTLCWAHPLRMVLLKDEIKHIRTW